MSVTVRLGPLDLGGSGAYIDGDGTEWTTSSWPSPGSPASTVQFTQRSYAPGGGWPGPRAAQVRSVPVNGWAVAQDTARLRDAFDRLNEACSIHDETPLTVTVDGDARWLMVLRQGDVLWQPVSDIAAKWSIQVAAADPRWFADPLSASTGLPSATGGLTVPFTVPFTIDETVVSGSVSLRNPGTAAGPVVIRVDGPCTGPIITHSGTGRKLVLATDLVLGSDQFVTIDMENELVLAQGQSRRNGWVVERGWSQFSKGDNTWLFTSAGGFNPSARMQVMAWPAWQ